MNERCGVKLLSRILSNKFETLGDESDSVHQKSEVETTIIYNIIFNSTVQFKRINRQYIQ